MEKAELEQKLAALQKENEALRAAHAEELAALQKSSAIDLALAAAGARNRRAVRALLEEGAITAAPDGTLTGLDEQLAALRSSDPYLFCGPGEAVTSFVPGESADALPRPEAAGGRLTYAQLAEMMR